MIKLLQVTRTRTEKDQLRKAQKTRRKNEMGILVELSGSSRAPISSPPSPRRAGHVTDTTAGRSPHCEKRTRATNVWESAAHSRTSFVKYLYLVARRILWAFGCTVNWFSGATGCWHNVPHMPKYVTGSPHYSFILIRLQNAIFGNYASCLILHTNHNRTSFRT